MRFASHRHRWPRAGLLFLTLVTLTSEVSDLRAFTSVQKVVVTAGVVTGGVEVPSLRIQHTPLINASDVTREIIILGETGEEVSPVPPPLTSRLTPESDFGPVENRKIRVRLRFRSLPIFSPLAVSIPPDVPAADEIELPPIEGPDPLAFAFQIPPNLLNGGNLQYRIIAERLEDHGGVLEPVSRVTFPETTGFEPNPWVGLGVTANASEVFGTSGGRFTLANGNPLVGQTIMDIPSGVLTGPTEITIDELSVNDPLIPPISPLQPVAVYRLDSNPPLKGLVQVSLLYPDFKFPTGQTGLLGATTSKEQDGQVVWWDGFAWRRLGGVVNANNNTIRTKIGFLNYMAIVAAAPISAVDRKPLEKIITPNGDGHNDTAIFSLGDLTQNVKIEIYDVTNHPIRTIDSLSSLTWDGRDDNGKVVESGVYIYQYHVDGTLVSGLIGVAK